METAIDAVTDVEDLIALYTNTRDVDDNIVLGTLNDWPEIPDILR